MYQPLPFYLTIKESLIHGLGLYAKRDIPKNMILGLTHIRNEHFENNFIRTPIGGFYNHSDNPNCFSYSTNESLDNHVGKVVENLPTTHAGTSNLKYLISIKDIKKGEEITSKYNLYQIS